MSNFWRDGHGADAVAVGIGNIGGIISQPRSGFKAFYGDRQDARPNSNYSRRPAPEPQVQEDPMEQARIEAFTMGFEEGCRVTQTVAAFIEDSDGKHALHVHPEDLPLIEGSHIGVPVVADAGLRRGSVRLDTADGWIEDGPDVRLSRLKAMLDDMEGKL